MTDSHDDERWVEVDRRILRTSADPFSVWDAWARSERLRQWFPDDAEGEPEPGGEIVHVWTSFGGMRVHHEVLEAEPGRRLLVAGESPMGSFRQEIVVTRDGEETVLELVHYGFAGDADWEGEYEGVDSGWQMALAVLRHYVESHFGRDRGIVFQMRPTSLGFEAIQPMFRTQGGLSTWLTRAGELEGRSVGDPVSLELEDGGRVTGRLLADSGRELALSWEEIDGVLELKVFRTGPDALAAALRCSAWGASPEETLELDRRLGAAMDRLVRVRR